MTMPPSRHSGRAHLCPATKGFCSWRSRRGPRHSFFATRAPRYGMAIGIVLVCTLTANADDYDRYDLSLRLPAAFSRFSPYAGVAAVGNAQGASRWSSSSNPASAAWPHPEYPYLHDASAHFSTLRFQEGTDVYVTTEAAVLNAGAAGVFVPTAAQIHSNHGQTSAGLGFKLEGDYGQVPWGKRIAENWAVGANLNFFATETRFDVADTRLARTRTDDYGLRLGALHQPLDSLRVGLTMDYGYAPAWTDRFDPFGRGTGTVRSQDVTQRVLVRTGLAWQYTARGTLYLDYQAGVFWNDTGTLWVHRFPLGVEYWLVPRGWVARMGTTVDTRGRAALTAGTGMAISKRAFVNLAYQYGMFPELRPEFGSAQTFAVSMVIGF